MSLESGLYCPLLSFFFLLSSFVRLLTLVRAADYCHNVRIHSDRQDGTQVGLYG